MGPQCDAGIDLKSMFEGLDVLVSSSLSPTVQTSEGEEGWLDKVMEANVVAFRKTRHLDSNEFSNPQDSDWRWQFVLEGLSFLRRLKQALLILAAKSAEDSGPIGPDALSVAQQQKLSNLLQIITALGSVPSFLPGVGLPADKRSKFHRFLVRGTRPLSEEQKYERLVQVTEVILEMLDHEGLNTIVITKHIGDLLAALIQLGYAPLMKPSPPPPESFMVEGDSMKGTNPNYVMSEERHQELTKDQERFQQELSRVMSRVYRPLLVKYLLFLQSSGASDIVRPQKPLPKSINRPASATVKPATAAKWLQKVCGSLLSALLAKPGGVLDVIAGVLDVGGDEGQSQGDVRKYQVIAHVISHPPSTTGRYSDLDAYFELVAPQVLSILDRIDPTDTKMYHMIACATIRAMAERSLPLSKRHVFEPLMGPLLRLCVPDEKAKGVFRASAETFAPKASGGMDVQTMLGEQDLSECIRRMHLVFVTGSDPCLSLLEHLRPVILVLMHLHCRICFGVSHIRKPVQDLVERFLKHSCGDLPLRAMRSFAFSERSERDNLIPMKTDLQVVPGSEGGVCVIEKNFSESEVVGNHEEDGPNSSSSSITSFYVEDDEKSIAIVDLLEYKKFRETSVNFYLSLISDLTDMLTQDDQDEKPNFNDGNNTEEALTKSTKTADSMRTELLQMEADLEDALRAMRKRLMVVRLIGLMSEDDQLQAAIMRNSEKMLGFLLATLRRAALMISQSESAEGSTKAGSSGDMQSVITALSLLKLHVLKDIKLSDWKILQDGLPDLQALEEKHQETGVRTLAGKLRRIIATHGAVIEHSETIVRSSAEIKAKNDLLTEKISELRANVEAEKSRRDQEEEGHSAEVGNNDSYESAIKNAHDHEIPIRGHGLISLTRLIESNDHEAVQHIDDVLKIFQDNLLDSDTYVYLQAIKGLASSSLYNADLVIGVLTKEYADLDDSKFTSKDKAVEVRTKLGEALVRVTKMLGELTPAHKNQLLNPFLGQINHPDPLVRASSLSNIGEICKNLRFSLSTILQEIFACLKSVLQWEKAVEVRRAGVLVITLLLQGLGRDAFRVLEGTLRDIWRLLITMKNNNEVVDDVTRVHVGQAIEEIDKIVKEFIQPKPSLSKTIYVLDEPPPPPPF